MNNPYKNYFSPKSAAQRYAKGRPDYHSFVIGKIKTFLAINDSFDFSLDIGCGTGLSSVALREISERVIGIDISEEMLKLAKNKDGIEYFSASAESLPFSDKKFDLITISQAIHWINKDLFFAEAARVLKPRSWIVAYDNYFLGRMLENPAFNDWYKKDFLRNYPIPPRGQRTFARESENANDFVLRNEEFHENIIEFSEPEIVNFLLTISNVIALVENGTQTIEEVSEWLAKSIKPFFSGNEKRKFAFNAPIWYLRRNF